MDGNQQPKGKTMETEIRNIIKQAIADSNLNGYEWKITKDGLWWSYSESEFVFEYRLCDKTDNLLLIKDKLQGKYPIMCMVGTSWYSDFSDIKKAIYACTKALINHCNSTY